MIKRGDVSEGSTPDMQRQMEKSASPPDSGADPNKVDTLRERMTDAGMPVSRQTAEDIQKPGEENKKK